MRATLFIATLFAASAGAAQPFDSFSSFRDSLTTVTQLSDASERAATLGVLWDTLQADGQIPYRQGQDVAFLYRGSANSVRIAGDFNGWNPASGPASRMGSSDVWIREESFPSDARLDYKIVRNESQWLLDPSNPLTQRGGFGDNSELRMPDYVPSPWVDRRAGVPAGSYSPNRALVSNSLGYTVNYRVYTPPGYDAQQLSNLPVLYVTDGHEYADDLMGSLRIVLDNMIAEERIPPVMAVFIDPRVDGNNLRASQYIENADFASFVADELIPVIDGSFRTDSRRVSRGILGTSLGGLNAAYFAATRP